MKRYRPLIAIGGLAGLLLVVYFTLRNGSVDVSSRLSSSLAKKQDSAALPPAGSLSSNERFNAQAQGAIKNLNQPLRFWGKVVDEDARPVGGVEVSYKARTVILPMFGAVGTKDSYGKAVTKDDGTFYVDAGKGDMLGLYGFTKPGYRLAQNTKTGFAYAGSPEIYHANAEQPVVFVMYRETALEPLRHYGHRFDLLPSGDPLTIDLMAGKISEIGQLKVTLWRNPLNVQPGHPFQWSVKIEVIGGGLAKADESKPFVAPEEGYEPSVDYAFRPKNLDWDPEWHGGIRKTFYVRTTERLYGRMQIELDARSQPPPCALFVEAWLNPKHGSRILEYDSTKQAALR